MMEVTGLWIKENVRKLINYDFDLIENSEKYHVTLSDKGVLAVQRCQHDKRFVIIVPGHGTVTAYGYTEETEQEKLDKLPNYLI